MKGTLPRLHRMIVPSKAVAADLVKHLRVPPDRISVIYHGVEQEFYEVTSAATYVAGAKNTNYRMTISCSSGRSSPGKISFGWRAPIRCFPRIF